MLVGIHSAFQVRALVVACAVPLDDHASRARTMFEAQDYAGAALEGSRALEVLPDLADIAVMRGRALMVPLLDEISEAEGDTGGGVPW